MSGKELTQEEALRIVAHNLHRLNESVFHAVEAGLTIEFIRSHRHHEGGNYGDQLMPVIKK